MKKFTEDKIEAFPNVDELQKELLKWFFDHGRKFPWRKTRNPYKILVAEKLLQQTRATEGVIQSYKKVIKEYPTIYELASCDVSELRSYIANLGLPFRASHLRIMSQEVVSKFGGKIPRSYEELLKLHGIGEYIARAILCFAYNQDVAIVDTNVGRFIYRIYDIKIPFPANPSRNKYIQTLAEKIIPRNKSRDFNLAILDLCALICTARLPKCYSCPIMSSCLYSKKTVPGK